MFMKTAPLHHAMARVAAIAAKAVCFRTATSRTGYPVLFERVL